MKIASKGWGRGQTVCMVLTVAGGALNCLPESSHEDWDGGNEVSPEGGANAPDDEGDDSSEETNDDDSSTDTEDDGPASDTDDDAPASDDTDETDDSDLTSPSDEADTEDETDTPSPPDDNNGNDSGAEPTEGAGGSPDEGPSETTTDDGENSGAGGQGGASEPNPNTGGAQAGGTPGIEPPIEGYVPMFVAIGKLRRTILSCDDGQTWIANVSENDDARCGEDITDCDHHEGSSTALAYGNGVFVANFGWGAPGRRFRSVDGLTWDLVPNYDENLSGLAFGNGVFVGGHDQPQVSGDNGLTWAASAAVGLSPRRTGFSPYGGGRFVMIGEAGEDPTVMVSADDGLTFNTPSDLPESCGANAVAIASGNDVIVAAGNSGNVCFSRDGGAAWGEVQLPENISNVVWHGDRFLAYSWEQGYSSPDGETWTGFVTQPTTLFLGAIASSPEGTLAAVSDMYGQAYEDQHFYRSTDGVSWETLPAENAVQSHAISHLVWGQGQPSAQCPAP